MDKISLNRLNGFKCVQEALRTDLKVNCIFFKQNYSTRNHKSDTSPVKNVVLLHWKTKCLQRPQSQETDAGRTRAIQQGNIWQAGDTVPGTLRDTKGGHCVPVVFPSFLSFLVFLSLFIHFFFCHSMFAGTSRERLSKSRRVRSAPAKRSLLWLITKCQGEGGGGGGGGGKSLYSGSV